MRMRLGAMVVLTGIALFFMALNLYGVYELIRLFTKIGAIKENQRSLEKYKKTNINLHYTTTRESPYPGSSSTVRNRYSHSSKSPSSHTYAPSSRAYPPSSRTHLPTNRTDSPRSTTDYADNANRATPTDPFTRSTSSFRIRPTTSSTPLFTTHYRLKHQFDRTTSLWTKRPAVITDELPTDRYRNRTRVPPRPRPTTPHWYYYYNEQQSTTTTPPTSATTLLPLFPLSEDQQQLQRVRVGQRPHALPRPYHPLAGPGQPVRPRPPNPARPESPTWTAATRPRHPAPGSSSFRPDRRGPTTSVAVLSTTVLPRMLHLSTQFYRIPGRVVTSRPNIEISATTHAHRVHHHHQHVHHHHHHLNHTTRTYEAFAVSTSTSRAYFNRAIAGEVEKNVNPAEQEKMRPDVKAVVVTFPSATLIQEPEQHSRNAVEETTVLQAVADYAVGVDFGKEREAENAVETSSLIELITNTPLIEPVVQQESGSVQDTSPEDEESLTVVTALMNIGRGDWYEYRRPLEKYHAFMENVLSLKVNLVVFTDDSSYEFIREFRVQNGLINRTKIHKITMEELPLHRYIFHAQKIIEDELKSPELWKVWDPQMQKHPEAKSPEYDILVNSKTYFLYNVTLEDPFRSDWFVWLDAGYGHGDKAPFPKDLEWKPRFPRHKISLIKITPEHDKISEYNLDRLYRQNWSVISGGFIAGDRHSIGQLFSLVHRKVIELINMDRVDDDQTVLVFVIKSHPHLFNILHGEWFDAFKMFPSRLVP